MVFCLICILFDRPVEVDYSSYATEQILLRIKTLNKTHCFQKQQKYHHHFVNTMKDDWKRQSIFSVSPFKTHLFMKLMIGLNGAINQHFSGNRSS